MLIDEYEKSIEGLNTIEHFSSIKKGDKIILRRSYGWSSYYFQKFPVVDITKAGTIKIKTLSGVTELIKKKSFELVYPSTQSFTQYSYRLALTNQAIKICDKMYSKRLNNLKIGELENLLRLLIKTVEVEGEV